MTCVSLAFARSKGWVIVQRIKHSCNVSMGAAIDVEIAVLSEEARAALLELSDGEYHDIADGFHYASDFEPARNGQSGVAVLRYDGDVPSKEELSAMIIECHRELAAKAAVYGVLRKEASGVVNKAKIAAAVAVASVMTGREEADEIVRGFISILNQMSAVAVKAAAHKLAVELNNDKAWETEFVDNLRSMGWVPSAVTGREEADVAIKGIVEILNHAPVKVAEGYIHDLAVQGERDKQWEKKIIAELCSFV